MLLCVEFMPFSLYIRFDYFVEFLSGKSHVFLFYIPNRSTNESLASLFCADMSFSGELKLKLVHILRIHLHVFHILKSYFICDTRKLVSERRNYAEIVLPLWYMDNCIQGYIKFQINLFYLGKCRKYNFRDPYRL